MYKEYVYEIFLYVIVILKFVYIINTFIYNIAKLLKWNTDTIDFLKEFKDNTFNVIDLFMNAILIMIFNPFQSKVVINREERFLLFIFGILGFIHYVIP
jgi:hypothetical protein